MRGGRGGWPLRRAWLAGVCAIALLQIVLGVAGLALAAASVEWPRLTGVRDWQRAVEIAALGALAAYLLLGARRDARIEHLGAIFLLLALFFANPPILALALALPEAAARGVLLIRALPVDAFIAALAWLFVRDFPRALESRRVASLVSAAIVLSFAAALALVVVNLVVEVRVGSDALLSAEPGQPVRRVPGLLGAFDRTYNDGHYWTVAFGLLLPVLPVVVWRARRAPPDERRRVRLFVAGVAVPALVPIGIAMLPPVSEASRELVHGRWGRSVLVPLNLLAILSMAAATAYAVAVQHVLDVRTVLRKAAQYGLARFAVGALAGVPFAWLGVLLYRARDEPLGELLTGARALGYAALVLAGFGVLRVRRRVMGAIDRVFFREAHDARQILAEVAERSGEARSTRALAASLTREIDRALHPESVALLVEAPEEGAYAPVAGTARRLPRSSALADRLSGRREAVRVDGGLRNALGEDDRLWLADAGAELLLPLVGSAEAPAGVLALGPKRSELAYSREDLLLLSAVGGAAGIALENLRLRESAGDRPVRTADERNATECEGCGRLQAPEATRCAECGAALRPAPLPLELFGKFRLERRIGAGAMGVVYRGTDLALDRAVALKTLPATRPEDAGRLRREARAMAAITHPHLALIFGAETWKGTPILVMEYLAGGTLAERISRAPLPPGDALALADVVAHVLESAHASGILHRDVKPSNIGFTREEVPKLLDFGLVRIAGAAEPAPAAIGALAGSATETRFVGTPLYMSPEALAGARPDARFDLWSLAVVAFEAIAGRHAFERDTPSASLAAIREGWSDALRPALPGSSAGLAELFSRALARDPSRRPDSARELARLVRATADALPFRRGSGGYDGARGSLAP